MDPVTPPPPSSPTSLPHDPEFTSFSSTPVPPPPSSAVLPQAPSQVKVVESPKRGLPKGVIIGLISLIVLIVGGVLASFIFKYSPSLGIGTTTITYWGLWEPESVMKPIIDEYQAANPRIKIVYQMQSPTEYRERLVSAISQGKGPDIFRIHNTWVPMFTNLLSPVPADVFSSTDFDSVFYPATRNDLRLGTNYVAVPLEFDGLAMFVNTGLLSAAGVSVPGNWEDLRTAAIAMSKCESADGTCHAGDNILVSGAALGSTNNIDHWQDVVSVLMLQNNVNFSSIGASQKAIEDAVNYYSDFVNLYHIWDSLLPNSTSQFASGKVGIYFAPSWRVFDIIKANPNLKFSIHPIPQLPLDPLRNEQPINWASYWAESVNSKSPHTKEAWNFIKYLSTKDTLVKFYQNSISSGRAFGEPYSRKDLADQLTNLPFVGAYVQQAPTARSWYLASFTQDGPSGINSKVSGIFANLISRKSDFGAFSTQLNQVLSAYGLSASAQIPQ